MNTRKAAMRTAKICLKLLILVLIVLGIVCLGKKAYELAYAAF